MENEVKNELVVVEESKYPALCIGNKSEELSFEDELLAEELNSLNGIKLKFPKIKLGASGNGKLEVPDAENPDDSSSVKELECVIVMATASRAKWDEDNNTIPECLSQDGKVSFDGKNCATCKHCKFSKDAEGKIIRPECKESRNVFVVTKDHSMPLQFTIPPSGIKVYDNFARDLLSARKTQLGSIVKISVETATNSANQKYNKAKFELVGRVDVEDVKRLSALRAQIAETLKSMTFIDIVEDEELKPLEDDSMPF